MDDIYRELGALKEGQIRQDKQMDELIQVTKEVAKNNAALQVFATELSDTKRRVTNLENITSENAKQIAKWGAYCIVIGCIIYFIAPEARGLLFK